MDHPITVQFGCGAAIKRDSTPTEVVSMLTDVVAHGKQNMIDITDHLAIPESELSFTASRSSGPGGQHVNKSSSRVILRFNVAASPSLSEAQKHHLLTRLATRVSKDGVLRVVSQKYRSQSANRRAALERFVTLMHTALTPVPQREQTTMPPAARQHRLEEKKRHGQLKQQRATRVAWDE
jgi:ribosome-associated protein